MPTKTDVTVYAGDDITFPRFRFLDGDAVPVDVSSWVWEAMWRSFPGSRTSIDLTVDLTDAVDGIVWVRAAAETTRAMRSGVWDLQETHDGITTTLIAGEVLWTEDVTRG